ncbi:hypothetical protein [Paenibacillus sp. FSL L8-0709]|uniref:hypothetical protein n=1 Tax=Paenibacillus sp. FSL L8-0709 TaxID=2975312 RepID=UPI0030FBE778
MSKEQAFRNENKSNKTVLFDIMYSQTPIAIKSGSGTSFISKQYSKVYYVLQDALPQVRKAQEIELLSILENLVTSGMAVKQPELMSGNEFIDLDLRKDFISKYEQDNSYEKVELIPK